MNAVEIEEAISALAERPFVAAEFPYSFLEAFGNKETTLKRLRSGASNKSDVGGVLQTNNIHIATCQTGEVTNTLALLKASPATTRAKARFVLATDGDLFEAEDLTTDDAPISCNYRDFPNYFGFFLPLAGITTVKQVRESSFDIRATSRLNKLYVELLKDNPAWGTAERRPDMNHFMARLIFCFFAEDTDIFAGSGTFTAVIETMSAKDSSNTHEIISTLFRTMNTKMEDRARVGIPRWADRFPYVNGGLFSGSSDVPRFSRIARSFLLHIGGLDWKKINPDIFGSMIQAVADEDERGALGMHYTSVPNILKVLNPLFLDDLRGRLDEAGDNARMLLNLRKRMSKIRVFDPACGSGNFLVIAYKEMRAIEADINHRREEADRRTEIPLTNFRGIELRDFPAEIARLALIIAEYQCDVLYRGQKEALQDFLPLDAQNWITCGNALRLDWLSICPPTGTAVKHYADDLFSTPLKQAQIEFENEGGETYVCGNPPYLGGKKQNKDQKLEMKIVADGRYSYLNLDYICAFFAKAIDCLAHFRRVAFVSTASLNQGFHVPNFWPFVINSGAEIDFCYEYFKWSNNATNNAGVHCTIIGLSASNHARACHIYFEDGKREVSRINPYLINGSNDLIESRSSPLSDLSKINTGNQAADGSALFFTNDEKEYLTSTYPDSKRLFRRVSGTSEFFDGRIRWCLWIDDVDLPLANSIEPISSRIRAVRTFRQAAGEVAKTLISRPHQFRFRNVTKKMGMLVPQLSSDRREYLPSGIFDSNFIVTHKAHAMFSFEFHNFAIFNSRLHFIWARALSGKLGSTLSYSSNLSWNTFPLPPLTEKNKADLSRSAEQILLAREGHFPATIAELYDPDRMPVDLLEVHKGNDEVLERIYLGRRFKNDTERLEKLFELYTKTSIAQGTPKKKVGTRA
ncbi:class I SAM-dependent DNA methyltransferase [Methylobacterium sp. Leaf99]|uniref:class I SAM-dependent DNA methyltransferase n=1 Tax=Methylobacterium sp. Leaf99 TaxID=1736251 RepID=UPI0009E6CB6C|nr:DNA methyltransferase [Methylobacterium sp. Leaf99]